MMYFQDMFHTDYLIFLAAQDHLDDMMSLLSESTMTLPANTKCPVCQKTEYKTHNGLKRHMNKYHPGMQTSESNNDSSTSSLFNHTIELMKMLLIKRVLDNAISVGDGETLSIVIKHMLLYFYKLGASNYAICCFEYTAQQQIFLSPLMALLVRQERFVNNHGGARRNVPIDLDVEHSNLWIKTHGRWTARGEVSEKVLNRLSMSQDSVIEIISKFLESFDQQSYFKRHSVDPEKYKSDVNKLLKHLKPVQIFKCSSEKTLFNKSLEAKSGNLLGETDMYKLRFWFRERLRHMKDELFYKY